MLRPYYRIVQVYSKLICNLQYKTPASTIPPQAHVAVDVDTPLNLLTQEQQLTSTKCIFKPLCVDESLCMNDLNPLHTLLSSPVSEGLLLFPTMSGVTDNRHIATTHVGNWLHPLSVPFAITSNPKLCACV
jgi:hypothetical protein